MMGKIFKKKDGESIPGVWVKVPKTFTGGLLPLAMQVASKTIGMDLVAVQPISMPSLPYGIFHIDYDSDDDTQI